MYICISRKRLWCIRKSLCTVHKSQHNCFLHPQMKPNKRKQNEPNAESSISSSTPSFIITVPECQTHFAVEMVSRIFYLIIKTVVHHHHRHHHCTGMPKPFCCGNGFCELYSKPILLWKWFLESSISSSTPSFIIITVPECQNHFAVENR